MALSEGAQGAVSWAFGAIQASVYAGESTAEVWSRLNDAAQARGLDKPPLSIFDVNELRHQAGEVASAAGALADATPDQSIDSTMIGFAPWSMDLNTLAAAPEYHARVEMTVADEQGNRSTGWITMTGINSLDMTVGDLNAIIQANAEAAAIAEGTGKTPRGSLVSTGRVELLVAPQA